MKNTKKTAGIAMWKLGEVPVFDPRDVASCECKRPSGNTRNIVCRTRTHPKGVVWILRQCKDCGGQSREPVS
jgi:hypothetical protein